MKKTLLLLLLSLVVMLFGCGEESSTEDQNSTISGNVLDKATQVPVSGVKVTIAEQEATSDASGHYQIANVPPDTYNLTAKTDNYASYDEEVSLSSGENIVDVELETFAAYCARVTSVTYQGRVYNTVSIGNQCWFKENLNVGTRIDADQMSTNNPTVEKYCYNDFVTNCDTYGGLYQWEEAMMYVSAHSNQGICPDGWHIPTKPEFETLIAFAGDDGNALKAIGEGNRNDESPEGAGTNTTGFSALLGGNIDTWAVEDEWHAINIFTAFWSSTEDNTDDAFYMGVFDWGPNIFFGGRAKWWGKSIRCLKD